MPLSSASSSSSSLRLHKTSRNPSFASRNTSDAPAHPITPVSTPSSDGNIDDFLAMIHGDDAHELQHMSSTGRSGGLLHALRDGAEGASFLPRSRRFSEGSAQSVQSFELYTPDEERGVLKKLDRRLVGFMALLYCLSFLDRSNIGNARIAGLEKELQLSAGQYEWLLWAFYITYIAFEWMTLLYRIVPPHIYISLCILSWGVIASFQAISTSFNFLLVSRALLGIGEAAFGPGVPFYLSFFFRRRELAFRTGLFISASPLSASFAGGLAWLITKLGGKSEFSPWRLLFLIEGFPSVLVAVWAWSFVPDGPGSARWLNRREREVAVLRLRSEKEAEEDEVLIEKENVAASKRSGVNLQEVLQTLQDPKCYLTAFMFFSCNVAFSSMPVFLPTIIRDMGYSSLKSQALSAPPYLFAFALVLVTAYLSDLYQSRSTFIILHSLLASLGYITIAICGYQQIDNTTIRYLALYLAASGFFSAITIIITWTINNQESDSKKGTGMAILNIIGQMGPLVGTTIFPETDGPWYVRGMTICALFMLLVGILAAALRWVLIRQNNKMSEEKTAGADGCRYAGIPLQEDGGTVRFERTRFSYIL